MGTDVFVMRQLGAKFTRTILVEKEEIKCIICDNLNPPELMPDGGVDYTWHTNVDNITREDIQKLGVESIGRLDINFLHHARISPCPDCFQASMEANSRTQGQVFKVSMGKFFWRV